MFPQEVEYARDRLWSLPTLLHVATGYGMWLYYVITYQELIMPIFVARGIVAGFIMTLMPRFLPIYNDNKD
jgi:hypothetical protein